MNHNSLLLSQHQSPVNNDPQNHFADVRKMVRIGSQASRDLEDYHFSRFACSPKIEKSTKPKETFLRGLLKANDESKVVS